MCSDRSVCKLPCKVLNQYNNTLNCRKCLYKRSAVTSTLQNIETSVEYLQKEDVRPI